nr:hypothetical protein [Candidatus Sigynarchaeota archaeon]
MEQINFRVSKDERRVIDLLAKIKGISISELAKETVLKDIASVRVELAFDLLKQGKIGRKQTWLISGLSASEFLVEWTKRGAEEKIPDGLVEWELDVAKNLDLGRYMRPSSGKK